MHEYFLVRRSFFFSFLFFSFFFPLFSTPSPPFPLLNSKRFRSLPSKIAPTSFFLLSPLFRSFPLDFKAIGPLVHASIVTLSPFNQIFSPLKSGQCMYVNIGNSVEIGYSNVAKSSRNESDRIRFELKKKKKRRRKRRGKKNKKNRFLRRIRGISRFDFRNFDKFPGRDGNNDS